jgi:hypothetical protein
MAENAQPATAISSLGAFIVVAGPERLDQVLGTCDSRTPDGPRSSWHESCSPSNGRRCVCLGPGLTTRGKIRRRLKVSLRAVLVFILLFAIWLGWLANRARDQREAVAAVQRSGGWVHYDYEFVNGKLARGRSLWTPRWLRRLGDEHFQYVRQVSLVYDDSTGKRFDNGNVEACDLVLARVSRLPGLKVLLLKETQATDQGLRHVGSMTGLEELFIWDAKAVTDSGVAQLAALKNLRNVHLSNSQITDDGLILLSRLPGVEELSLQGNRFTDNGLARLAGQERLKRLHIGLGHGRITDAGLVHLKDFQNLEVLDLQNTQITVHGLKQLSGLRKLKQVWVSGTELTVTEKQTMRDAMPGVTIR